jgi:hypothetical protein
MRWRDEDSSDGTEVNVDMLMKKMMMCEMMGADEIIGGEGVRDWRVRSGLEVVEITVR